MPNAPVVVYTDGACSGNPGPGGWAWAEPGGAWANGHAEHTTNQRMEITAAYEAAVAHPGALEIVTDSTYVMHCFEKGWFRGWLKNGWRNSAKKPVANRDLWEPFVELYLSRPGEISFRWVKGHSGDVMNDLVDQLAVAACTHQHGRSGATPPDPEELGPPDVPRRGSARTPAASSPSASASSAENASDPRVPLGHRLVVWGLRPPELGGWDANPVADGVRRRLTEIIRAKAQLHADLVVLTGLRLGAEMLAAEAARAAAVPFVAILPYPDPESVWSAESQRRFRDLCDAANAVVTLERKVPRTKADAGKALARRDGWLAANAHEAVLVWDGDHPSLRDLHAKVVKRLGEEEVWVLDPGT